MSDAVAGQRLPMQGGLHAAARRRASAARYRLGTAESVQLGLQQHSDSLVVLVLAGLILPPLFRWAVTHATISGMTRAACTGDGACWTFIRVRFPRFIYGSYPPDQHWRVDVAFALLVAFCTPVLRDGVRHRWLWVLLLLIVFPSPRGVLLWGGVLGLAVRRHLAVGRADARRHRVVRHRGGILAARDPAGVRPALAIAGRADPIGRLHRVVARRARC